MGYLGKTCIHVGSSCQGVRPNLGFTRLRRDHSMRLFWALHAFVLPGHAAFSRLYMLSQRPEHEA